MSLYNKILDISKKIAIEEGLNNINMRLISKECNIALGSIYNYFPSKSDLIIATIESIWKDIFNLNISSFYYNNFIDCISNLFETISKNIKKYPNFFILHSISFNDKGKGKEAMNIFLQNIKNQLIELLNNDKNIRCNVFNDVLTPTIFIDYIFSLIISLLIQNKDDCKPLLKFIENTIY